MQKYHRRFLNKTLAHLALGVGTIIMIAPFIWMVSTSLKSQGQAFTIPPRFIPSPIVWGGWIRAVTTFPFIRFAFNTMKITVSVTLANLLTCSLAGYAFARLRFRGRDALFLCYLATMMIPIHVKLIPIFLLLKEMKLINTHLGLILPGLTGAFGTFLMRQFFLNIPRDLEDAGKLDGCTPFGIYWRIFLPLSKPVLSTLGLFTFMAGWNDFLLPLILLSTESKKTLTIGLTYFIQEWTIDTPGMMAAITLALIPILVVFLFAQRSFIKGITLTGLKN